MSAAALVCDRVVHEYVIVERFFALYLTIAVVSLCEVPAFDKFVVEQLLTAGLIVSPCMP